MTLLYASMEGVGWAVQGPSAWGVASHVSCITPERRHLPSGSSDCKAQAQHASPPSTQEWTQSEAGEQSEARGEASDAATRTRGTCNDVAASPFQGLPAQEVICHLNVHCSQFRYPSRGMNCCRHWHHQSSHPATFSPARSMQQTVRVSPERDRNVVGSCVSRTFFRVWCRYPSDSGGGLVQYPTVVQCHALCSSAPDSHLG